MFEAGATSCAIELLAWLPTSMQYNYICVWHKCKIFVNWCWMLQNVKKMLCECDDMEERICLYECCIAGCCMCLLCFYYVLFLTLTTVIVTHSQGSLSLCLDHVLYWDWKSWHPPHINPVWQKTVGMRPNCTEWPQDKIRTQHRHGNHHTQRGNQYLYRSR